MPKIRMTTSGGLHESLANQQGKFYESHESLEIWGDVPKLVQSPNYAILQILYNATLHFCVSLDRLVPLLYS